MVKPIFIKKKKLKTSSLKREELSITDVRNSAKKTEQNLKVKKHTPTEFIEVEE